MRYRCLSCVRTAVSFGFVVIARSFSAAFVAWWISDVWQENAATSLLFLFVWTALLGLLYFGPTALLEIVFRLGFSSDPVCSGLVSAILGALWAILFGRCMRLAQVLVTPSAVALVSLSGGVAAALSPPSRNQSFRKSLLIVGGMLILTLVVSLLFLNLEAEYDKRYAENRLGSEQLALEPFVSGPTDLSVMDVARAVAHTWMRTHPVHRLRWSWEESVAVIGLLAYAHQSGDNSSFDYVAAWGLERVEEALTTPLWADAAAPAIALLILQSEGRLPDELHPIIERIRDYIEHDAPRTSEGGISHPGLLVGGVIPAQLWVDSLFMHGMFLNLLYEQGDDWAGTQATRLGLAMIDALQDPDNGLFRHAFLPLFPGVSLTLPIEKCFWARGNAWAAWFLVDHFRVQHSRGMLPHPALHAAWVKLYESLKVLRDTNGMWHTDLDFGSNDAGNPLETSASALITAAFRRAHAIGLSAASPMDADELSIDSLLRKIRWDGGHPTVVETSTATLPGFRAFYRAVVLDENVGHGVGALLLALCAE